MPDFLDFLNHPFGTSLRLVDLLDVALVSLAFYFVFVWLRRRVSRAVGLALAALMVAYILAQILDLYLTTMAFRVGLTFLVFGFVLVFQEDIRRLFERLRTFRLWSDGRSEHDSWSYLDEIAEAVWAMSRASTGALIVLKGEESLEVHTHGGTEIDARVTRSLLESLFHPGTPSHDGAVVLDGERIEAFGVHLPLSTDDGQPVTRGTRHAAAVGLAERTDAIVVAVSEETGRVSLAREGRLEAVETQSELEDRLEQHFDLGAGAESTPRWKRLLTVNPAAKIGSILLAAVLWFVLANDVATVQRTYRVPIEYRNLRETLAIEQQTSRVRVQIDGPERAFRDLNPDTLSISLDLSEVSPGSREFILSSDQLSLPSELAVRDIEPSRVSVTIFELVETTLPVAVRTRNSPPEGLRVADLEPQPPAVTVRVRRALENRITELPTTPIDLAEIDESTTVETALVPLPNVRWTQPTGGRIQVDVQLEGAPEGEKQSPGG